MIQITLICPHCQSENIRKNGFDKNNGKQKYHCKDCLRYGTLGAEPWYTEEKKDEIINAYYERPSLRGIQRIFGVSRHVVSKWLKQRAELAENKTLEASIADVPSNDTLELDELHSFVQKKSNDQWLWAVISRTTLKIVAFYIGNRSQASCQALWDLVPERLKGGRTFSDRWAAYEAVIKSGCHESVYKDSGQTNHIERWNNTIRQHLGRYTRKTLSFSKNITMHNIVTRLFIIHYNNNLISL
jgi:IS1 family transposase/transposase-like protein